MSFIVPDEIAEKLICSECKKYLSIKPVKVYPGGIIKCGRCSNSNTSEEGAISFFGHIAQFGLFPCINRYEGCKQYLSYHDSQVHESKCISGKYPCPLCPAERYTPASAYDLLVHYKLSHKKEILSHNEFCIEINKNSSKNFIYVKNGYIFIIYVRNDITEKYLLLNAINIGPEERVKEISQHFNLLSLNKDLLYQTSGQCCSSTDKNFKYCKVPLAKLLKDTDNYVVCQFNFDVGQSEGIILLPDIETHSLISRNVVQGLHNVYPKIYLSEEVRNDYPDYYLSQCKTKLVKLIDDVEEEFPRICHFCENIFQNSVNTSAIYKCEDNHYKCQTCFTFSSCCCNYEAAYATQDTHLYSLLYFYCKWDCGRFYCGQDLRYHENHCRENYEINFREEAFIKKYLDHYFVSNDNYKYLNTNLIDFQELEIYSCSKIYVVTRDNFNFILNFTLEENNIHFWFTHKYSTEKYFILVKIKERFLPYYYRVNSFTLDYNNKNILNFAVVLRKL